MTIWDNFDLAFWPELRLLACYVSLLTNKCVLYLFISEKSMEIGFKSPRLDSVKFKVN